MVLSQHYIIKALSALLLCSTLPYTDAESNLLRGGQAAEDKENNKRQLQEPIVHPEQGVFLYTFTGISGSGISSLTGAASFPDSPTTTTVLTDLLEIPSHVADSYGSRLVTWLIPPVTGDYTFWVASDDGGQLFLSTDSEPENKVLIAKVDGWASSRQWFKDTSQESEPITLVAGKTYYLEGLHKEGGGGDNFAVAWAIPGSDPDTPVVIEGQYLSKYPHPLCATDADCNDNDWCTENTCDTANGRCNPPVDISQTPDRCPPLDAFCNSITTCTSNLDGTDGSCDVVPICDDSNPCSQDTCDTVTNTCSYSRIADCDFEGAMLETWTNIGWGGQLNDLYANSLYPDSPSVTQTITGVLEVPVNRADGFGSRITTYIVPPATGNYTFWVASDDMGELYLSTNNDPENIGMIAYVHGHTSPRQWNKFPETQQSSPIALVAGETYYLEGRHKEGGGGDNFAVAWAIPGSDPDTPVILEDRYFAKYPPIACTTDADCNDNDWCTQNTCDASTGRCSTVDVDLSLEKCPPFSNFNEGTNTCTSNHDNTGSCVAVPHPFVFIGCFTDSTDAHNRDLPTYLGAGYNHETCHQGCLDNGNKYFGLQGNGLCFCGDSYGRYGETSCDEDACSIDSTNFGYSKNCIFEDRCTTDADCNDNDWCTQDTCDKSTGMCSTVDISAQQCPSPIDDFCNSITTCTSNIDGTGGSCGVLPKCDDFNPCTEDTCDNLAKTCSHAQIDGCSHSGEGAWLDTWTGISGNSISFLLGNPSFPDSPSVTQTVTGPLEVPVNRADGFGSRLTAYITAPATGDFTFWVASDDGGELYLSTDTNPKNKRRIAYVDGHTGSRHFTKYASQRSTPIALVAGKSYYVEAVHKEGGGGDNLAVGWAIPGKDPNRAEVIESQYFAKYPPVTSEGYKYDTSIELEGWTQAYGKGKLLAIWEDYIKSSSAYTKQGSHGFRRLQSNTSPVFYVRRRCLQCADTHQDIIYKRLTPIPEGMDFYHIFVETWKDYPANVNLIDFTLHSSMEDALQDKNPWSYCNYNNENIGFPRECGPYGWVGSQWFTEDAVGQPDIGIYVWDQNPDITDPARDYPSTDIFGDNQTGLCVNTNGEDQNSGVYKVESGDFQTPELQTRCLQMCAAYPGRTGCEAIWSDDNRGCYVHTQEVDRGNGAANHACWVVAESSAS